MSTAPPRVLAVAGSDSGGGAGLPAELKTVLALGAHGMSVVTEVTARDSLGEHGSWELPEEAVRAQFLAVAGDIGVQAVTVGPLPSARLAGTVADLLAGLDPAVPVVVDPEVPGRAADDTLAAVRARLLPRATVACADLGAAERLTGLRVTGEDGMRAAAEALLAFGPRWVLLTGGRLPGAATDLLWDGEQEHWYRAVRQDTPHTGGAGATLAAAVAVHLARGATVPEAAGSAKRYVTAAVAAGYPLGAGTGPVDQGWRLR